MAWYTIILDLLGFIKFSLNFLIHFLILRFTAYRRRKSHQNESKQMSKCRNVRSGCKAELAFENVAVHSKKCPYREIKCVMCPKLIEMRNYKIHLQIAHKMYEEASRSHSIAKVFELLNFEDDQVIEPAYQTIDDGTVIMLQAHYINQTLTAWLSVIIPKCGPATLKPYTLIISAEYIRGNLNRIPAFNTFQVYAFTLRNTFESVQQKVTGLSRKQLERFVQERKTSKGIRFVFRITATLFPEPLDEEFPPDHDNEPEPFVQQEISPSILDSGLN